jgi:hypothetical protein
MPRVFTATPGLVAQIGNYGPASNDVAALVPATVAAECARDPRLRVEPGGAPPAAAVPAIAIAPLDDTPGGISTVNSDRAVALIAEADDVDELDRLEAGERASQRHPGGRKGVLAALVARRAEVAADVPEDLTDSMNRAPRAQEE